MTSKLRLPTLVLLIAAIAHVPSAFADVANRYEGTNWTFLDPKEVLQAVREVTSAGYPDCDEATIDKKMMRVYRPDGTGEAQDETYVKVLTEKGKRDNRTLSLNFMLPYYTVEVVRLEVLKPTGEIVKVDVPANSSEATDDSQMQSNIYDPNNRVLRVNIPQLEVGDVVHSITRLTVNRAIMPGEFAEENLFEGPGYTRHESYEVHAPAERPLKRVFVRDEIRGTLVSTTRTEGTNGLVYHWEVNHVPRMFDEPSMPPYEMVLQRLLVSTTPNWADVSRWYWELSKPHMDARSAELDQTAQGLVAGKTDEMDKIKAVFYYVSKKVRYMGLTPEKDRPGFEPHDVRLTFEKKYGVCRDKAALLVSMLRGAGLPAYPVLISVGSKRDPEVPDPDFNHAIVGVELTKGNYLLMDPTDENTRELLPSSDCDQSYLVCRAEGEQLKVSPIKPPEENMMRIKTTGVLSGNGRLEGRSVLWFDGVNDNSYREAFAHMKPDDQRRFFERDLKSVMPGAHLKSLKLTPENMLDVSTPVHAELEFAAEGLTAQGNGKAVLSVPWLGKGMGMVNFILGGAGLEQRKYPLRTFVACGLKEEVSLTLTEGFAGAISMPSCVPMDDRSLSYQETFSCQEGALDCSRELKLKVVEFSPGEYQNLKHALGVLEYDARKAPVLALRPDQAAKSETRDSLSAEPPVESNAQILDSRKELEIADTHTATFRLKYAKKILTYSGKIREAEVKVDYNPACQEARLVRAAVTAKSGKRQEISKDEINVMDAGWNASAKRYTGGKILVANLPGVDIGSTIEVELEITSKGKPFLAGFESFQLADALDRKTFRLIAPESLPIEKMVSGKPGSVQEQKQSENGKQILQWDIEHASPLPAESQLPPDWVYSSVVGYFVGDPKAYFSELREILVKRSTSRAKVQATVAELTRACTNKTEAVLAIRNLVAKAIRLAGPSFTDLPLDELSDADTTLKDGYGHWADRAILLHAMLSAAGFAPEFVLASGLPPIAGITNVVDSFPLPHAFQAPLVRIAIDGQVYYLNDTDQSSKLGSTAYDGCLALRLADQTIEVIRAAQGCGNQMDTFYSLSVADSGKTRIGVTHHYYGTGFNERNRYFSELPPEERRRYFQEIVSDVAQGARPVGEFVTQFDRYPGLEQYTVDIDNYSVVDGKYLYFDLPFTPSLFPLGADHRTLPVFISHQGQSTVRTEIELPPGFRQVVIAPASEKLEVPGGGGIALVTSGREGNKCVITHKLETSPAIVSPKDYASMLDLESTLGRKSSRLFLLERN